MAAAVIVLYFWITLLHCLFVGICVYTLLGHWLVRTRRVVAIVLCGIALAGIETYWLPFMHAAGAALTVGDSAILRAFNLRPGENIISHLAPGPGSIVAWVVQGYAAEVIGRWAWRRAIRKAAAVKG